MDARASIRTAWLPLLVLLAASCRELPTAHQGGSAGGGPTSAPFAGSCDVAITQETVSPQQVRLSGRGQCVLSQLGRSVYAIDQMVDPTQGVVTGTVTWVAANGDELRATLTGSLAEGGDLGRQEGTVAFVGGTGRFLNASGSATFARGAGRRTGQGEPLPVDRYAGTLQYRSTGGGEAVRLEVVPGTLLLPAVGAQQQLTVYAVDQQGQRSPVAASFEVSSAGIISVSADGVVTALNTPGSSQITARVGTLTSAPVLAVVATPAAGALLVSDEQVVSPPVAVDPEAPYMPGWRYRVQLRGVAPAVGQIVLATGSAPIGGRATSFVDVGGGVTDVELELVPISAMFQEIAVNESLSLANAPVVEASAGAPSGGPATQPRRRLAPASRLLPSPAGSRLSRAASGAQSAGVKFDVGRFSCVLKTGVSMPLSADLTGFDVFPDLSYDLDIHDLSVRKVVVRGELESRASSNPVFTAAVAASAECKALLRTQILPIGGPISLIVGGQLAFGIGLGVEAKANLPGFGWDAFVQSRAQTAFGFDCTSGSCLMVGNVTTSADGFFKPLLPSLDAVRTELKASLFGYADLQFGNPFLKALNISAIGVKAGLVQKGDFATELTQAMDAAYASSLELRPIVEAATTPELQVVVGLLNLTLPELKVEPELPIISRSPAGTFTIEPSSVAAGTDQQLGGKATFTVTLDPVTYLGLYAVDHVEIRWLRPDVTGALQLEPGRPGCTTLQPTSSGQSVFTCETDFLSDDEGTHTFFAFVRPKLFGQTLPFGLEIGSATLDVNPPAAVTLSPASTTLPPGGSEQFTATVSGAADQAVTWSADGGTITQDGLYTAGTTPGTYVVTATSVADPGAQGTATVTITGEHSPVTGSVSVRAERAMQHNAVCETDAKTGLLPLAVSARCEPLPRADEAPHPGASVQLLMSGSAGGVTWGGSAVTEAYNLGDLPTLLGGFGNVNLPAPAGGGSVSVGVNPGWASAGVSITVSVSYRGDQVTARFRRFSDGSIFINIPVAVLTIPDVESDEMISVVMSFTCDSGSDVTHTNCVGSGQLGSVVVTGPQQ